METEKEMVTTAEIPQAPSSTKVSPRLEVASEERKNDGMAEGERTGDGGEGENKEGVEGVGRPPTPKEPEKPKVPERTPAQISKMLEIEAKYLSYLALRRSLHEKGIIAARKAIEEMKKLAEAEAKADAEAGAAAGGAAAADDKKAAKNDDDDDNEEGGDAEETDENTNTITLVSEQVESEEISSSLKPELTEEDTEQLKKALEEIAELQKSFLQMIGSGGVFEFDMPFRVKNFFNELFYQIDRDDREGGCLKKFFAPTCLATFDAPTGMRLKGINMIANGFIKMFEKLKVKHEIVRLSLDSEPPARCLAYVSINLKITVESDEARSVRGFFELVKFTPNPITASKAELAPDADDEDCLMLQISNLILINQDARPLFVFPEAPIPKTHHYNWEEQFDPNIMQRREEEAAVAAVGLALESVILDTIDELVLTAIALRESADSQAAETAASVVEDEVGEGGMEDAVIAEGEEEPDLWGDEMGGEGEPIDFANIAEYVPEEGEEDED